MALQRLPLGPIPNDRLGDDLHGHEPLVATMVLGAGNDQDGSVDV